MLGGEPPRDVVALRGARLDQPLLPDSLVAQQSSVSHDLVLVADHLVDECRVLLGDGIDGLDPGDEVVEAAGAENHGEGRLLVFRRVDRNEPLRQCVLRAGEVHARDAERLPVHTELLHDVP
jgi:hypothetical protein